MKGLAVVLALLAVPAGAGVAPGPLKREIDRIVDRPAFGAAFWGIEVRSLRSGNTLYARNAQKNFKPASTQKLVTTAAALDAFGPAARVRTTVETAGRLDAFGRILGDLYLVGRGDPSLSPPALEDLAEGLRAAGVRRIEGRLVGHEGVFKGERRGSDWGWEDLVWRYGAEVSALSLNDNTAKLTLVAGERAGDAALVEWTPRSAYYTVVSTVTTSAGGTKSDLTLTRAAGGNLIRLAGTHPLGGTPWEGAVAVEDPARYTALVFAEVLATRGIPVTGGVATSADPLPGGLRVLAARESPPLAERLKTVNKESRNLHAEILLRLLGAQFRGEASVEAGQEAVRAFLGRVGVRPESWPLQDGSGLSRSDLLDPHGLVSLLVAMDRHPHAAAFRDSLPIAGVDGTLENRMKGTPAQGRVLAKTGTLRQGNALAGYVLRRDGERLVFAAFVNNHVAPGSEAVTALDAIAVALTGK